MSITGPFCPPLESTLVLKRPLNHPKAEAGLELSWQDMKQEMEVSGFHFKAPFMSPIPILLHSLQSKVLADAKQTHFTNLLSGELLWRVFSSPKEFQTLQM